MMVLTSLDNRKIRQAYNKELAKEGLGPAIENMMKDPKFISSMNSITRTLMLIMSR